MVTAGSYRQSKLHKKEIWLYDRDSNVHGIDSQTPHARSGQPILEEAEVPPPSKAWSSFLSHLSNQWTHCASYRFGTSCASESNNWWTWGPGSTILERSGAHIMAYHHSYTRISVIGFGVLVWEFLDCQLRLFRLSRKEINSVTAHVRVVWQQMDRQVRNLDLFGSYNEMFLLLRHPWHGCIAC